MGPTYPPRSAQPAVDEAPAPLLAGLGRPDHRVPGLIEVGTGVLAGRGVAARHVPARQALAQVHPVGEAVADAVLALELDLRLGVAGGRLQVLTGRDRAGDTADGLRLPGLGQSGVADVEHRLLDVERREHVLHHLVWDPARAADVQHLLALGLQHL